MKSTLVEPPPNDDDDEGLDEDSIEFIRAESVQELAQQTNIGSDEVLDRVLLPGKRFGSYHILGFVAAGGMGEIYAARRVNSDGSKSKPVALKVITAEYANDWRIIERFKREARISKAIRSRHVARVYEFGESPQGHVFLSMELLGGEELFDRLHRHRILSPMTMAKLSLQILKGLHKIHKSGFVHRDIKPENIFLATDPDTQKEQVKILDFGIAKRAAKKSDPLLSVVGQIYGTPQYIAPEQAVNPDVDHRADLYSLGVVLYECVSGSLPFDGESPYDTIVSHQNEPVPPLPSSIDPEFAHIIYQALAKTPEDRFQSAVEMGRIIKRWIDETSWVEEEEPAMPLELELSSLPADDTTEDIQVQSQEYPETATSDQAAATVAHDLDDSFPPSSDEFLPDGYDDAPKTDPEPMEAPNVQPLKSQQRVEETSAVSGGQQRQARPQPAPPVDYRAQPDPGVEPGEAPPSTDEMVAPTTDPTTELRSPQVDESKKEITAEDTRNAQIITGVALGLLILAILWAVFL